MPEVSDHPKRLKVFISYSRADMAFADELVDGLELIGFETMIDRHSILEGEDWKTRLGGLIQDADTIVFIVSPDSARSELCRWEVEEAHRLSKRILPVLWKPPGDVAPPAQLSALNYVRFDEGHPFVAGLRALGRALNSDVAWLREHTRLLARAMEWDGGGRSEIRLLSGSDIADAKAWATGRPKDAPEPTPLHLEFIRQSENAEALRQNEERKRLAQLAAATSARETALKAAEAATHELAAASRRLVFRTTAGAMAALLFGVTAAGAALYAFNERSHALTEAQRAEQQRLAAVEQRQIADGQRKIAEQQTALARRQRLLLTPGPLTESKLGDDDAPIVMIEYSSLTCQHCAQYHSETFPKIKSSYIDKGQVLYISRPFPLDDLATAAYMLARCKTSEKSFEFLQDLLGKQGEWVSAGGSPVDKLYGVVKDAGFTRAEFESCLRNQELLDKIIQTRTRGAKALNIDAVPIFFINELTVRGSAPLAEFEKAFATYLEGGKK